MFEVPVARSITVIVVWILTPRSLEVAVLSAERTCTMRLDTERCDRTSFFKKKKKIGAYKTNRTASHPRRRQSETKRPSFCVTYRLELKWHKSFLCVLIQGSKFCEA